MLVNRSNKAMQLDNLRAVQLCAARCAPFVAHNRPARKLRLMAALCEKRSDVKKYTRENIKTVSWEEHARQNPELYFDSTGPTRSQIIDGLARVASILGATNTSSEQLSDWSYFYSDIDWLFNSKREIETIENVFLTLQIFPESKEQNSYRPEALTTPFSTDVFTLSQGVLTIIKGNSPSEDHLNHAKTKMYNNCLLYTSPSPRDS